MKAITLKATALALLGVLALVGGVGYSYLRPPAEATAPIEAVALEQTTPAMPDSAARVFEIVPEESEARFVIDEVLQGAPKTVIGTTDQVAGRIAVDPRDLDTAQVGTILINARTFATDSSQRDRAIQNWVLQTAQHEYVAFTPTGLLRLPDGASAGEAVPFQVVGDLTIGGVTRPVTFDATVAPESADRLEGSASTTIRYADWGIAIPQVPAVASVSDTVRLELDFAAAPA
jgi:polyisoprenoid-binding protein YceI